MKKKSKIIAVVVAYNPTLGELESNINAVINQVEKVILVNNSDRSEMNLSSLASTNLEVVELGENMGIAYAQNVGIEAAIRDGAEYILLLDQDSVPYSDMVERLYSRYAELKEHDENIAAVAPVCIDERSGLKSYFLTSRFGIPHRYKPQKKEHPNNLIRAGFLISSGSLIDVNCFRNVGGKRSNYFIDHVDTEWCLRARSMGYILIGSHDAFMSHSIGDEVRKFWFFYMRTIPYHTPLRDYYMFRNTIFTIRDINSFRIWRLFLIYRLVQFMIYFLIFAPQRALRFKCMLMGLYHGVRGCGGRVDLSSGTCTVIPKTSIEP